MGAIARYTRHSGGAVCAAACGARCGSSASGSTRLSAADVARACAPIQWSGPSGRIELRAAAPGSPGSVGTDGSTGILSAIAALLMSIIENIDENGMVLPSESGSCFFVDSLGAAGSGPAFGKSPATCGFVEIRSGTGARDLL